MYLMAKKNRKLSSWSLFVNENCQLAKYNLRKKVNLGHRDQLWALSYQAKVKLRKHVSRISNFIQLVIAA